MPDDLCVELVELSFHNVEFKTIVGVIKYSPGQMETAADLREEIDKGVDIQGNYAFLKGYRVVERDEEMSLGADSVIKHGNGSDIGGKVVVKALGKLPSGLDGFSAQQEMKVQIDREYAEHSLMKVFKETGFMKKLDIFSGVFERFFFKLDNDNYLYCFGPCDASEFAYAFRNMSVVHANEYLDLAKIVAIRPYEGAFVRPSSHYCAEIVSSTGNKWTLAMPSVTIFSTWVKRFHETSDNLPDVKYNIAHATCEWTIEAKVLGDKKDTVFRIKSGSNKRDNQNSSPILSFYEAVFREAEFGLKLANGIEGTFVLSVWPGSAASTAGVKEGDYVIAINEISVVGDNWPDVRDGMLNAGIPVRVTFGKPHKKPAVASRGPKTTGIGLFKFGRKSKSRCKTKTAMADVVAKIPEIPLPAEADTAVLFEKIKQEAKVEKALYYEDPVHDYIPRDRARVAASQQLTRYKSAQRRLYKAIQESYDSQEHAENFVQNIMKEMNERNDSEGIAAMTSSRFDTERIIKRKTSSTNKFQVQSDQPVALPKKQKGILHFAKKMFKHKFGKGKDIPMLLASIREGDVSEKETALDVLLDITSNPTSLSTLIESGAIPVFADALKCDDEDATSIEIKENCAGLLWNLSDEPEAFQQIVDSGVVSSLLALLEHEADDIVSSDVAKEEAAGALWNLTDNEYCKEIILQENGIKTILSLLGQRSGVTDFAKENLTGIIWNLVLQHKCLVAIMEAENPTPTFVQLITKGTASSAENIAGALMRISMCKPYRKALIACPELIPSLVQLLAFGTSLGREHACGALQNIATQNQEIQRLIVQEGAVPPLIRLLKQTVDASLKGRAALCLRTLAENPTNRKEIEEARGIEALAAALTEKGSNTQIYVVDALCALAADDDRKNALIVKSVALPKLVDMLQNGSEYAMCIAAGAISSLAQVDSNRQRIAGSGAVKSLAKIIQCDSNEDAKRQAAKALGILALGDENVQGQVMDSLERGKLIGLNERECGKLKSVRARLDELT